VTDRQRLVVGGNQRVRKDIPANVHAMVRQTQRSPFAPCEEHEIGIRVKTTQDSRLGRGIFMGIFDNPQSGATTAEALRREIKRAI
jgi:hypothetical protein